MQAEPVFYNAYGKPITREEAGYAEEDVDEEEEYVLNDEEEEEFLAWQAESGNYPPPSNNSYISQVSFLSAVHLIFSFITFNRICM